MSPGKDLIGNGGVFYVLPGVLLLTLKEQANKDKREPVLLDAV